MTFLFDDITATLDALISRSGAELQADLLIQRALETGGHVKPPVTGDSWDSQRVEIHLHGVFAEGGDWPEAIRNWRRAAVMAASAQARAQSAVTAAEAVIARPEGAEAEALAQACQTVLDHAALAAPLMPERARALLASLERAEVAG